MQGGAPPLIRGIDVNAARHKGLQTLEVAAGGGVMKGSPEGHESRQSDSAGLQEKKEGKTSPSDQDGVSYLPHLSLRLCSPPLLISSLTQSTFLQKKRTNVGATVHKSS